MPIDCEKCGAPLQPVPADRCGFCGAPRPTAEWTVGALDGLKELGARQLAPGVYELSKPLVFVRAETSGSDDSDSETSRFCRQLEFDIANARDAQRRGVAVAGQIDLLERVHVLALAGKRREAMELLVGHAKTVRSRIVGAAVCYFLAVAGASAALACRYLVSARQGGPVAAILLVAIVVVPGTIVGTIFLILWLTGRDFNDTPYGPG